MKAEQDKTDNIKKRIPGIDHTLLKCWHELEKITERKKEKRFRLTEQYKSCSK